LTFDRVSVGGAPNVCGVTTSGEAYCWGRNVFGELGDGSTQDHPAPTLVTGGRSFGAVAVGKDYFACGLTTSGAAYCWGRNEFGQLGNGTFANSSTPTAVSGGLSFVAIVTGFYHACGLTATGDAYCWGNNSLGQLGNGGSGLSPQPVLVTGGHTFTALSAAGGQHTCGLSADGVLRCWGLNTFGQLGVGPIGPEQCPGAAACSKTPVAVTGGLLFSSVSAGGWHTCALTTTGVLYCWGDNEYGELGDGSAVNRSQPVKVAGQP